MPQQVDPGLDAAGFRRAGPSAPPKLLLLIDGMVALTDGGTERQLLQLVKVARLAGMAPTVAVLRGTEWLTSEVAGCPVEAFSVLSLRTPAGLGEMWRLLGWMRRQQFSILQSFFHDANLIGPILGRAAGVRVIFGTRRSLGVGDPEPSRAVRLLARLSAMLVTRILTNAEAVSECVRRTEGIDADKLQVLYNGVDIERMQPATSERANVRKRLHVENEDLLVGNISGLRAVKGLELFLRAAKLAHARLPRLRFVIVGEGHMRPRLEQLIDELRLAGVVTLAGAQQDVRPWLAAFDIAVLCSDAEGFSNSILEYMAASLPVIATEVGGNREALGDTGLLVPAGHTEELAAAMVRMADPALRARAASAGRARVERFSLAVAEARMAELYRFYCPELRSATAAIGEESRSAHPATPSTVADVHTD